MSESGYVGPVDVDFGEVPPLNPAELEGLLDLNRAMGQIRGAMEQLQGLAKVFEQHAAEHQMLGGQVDVPLEGGERINLATLDQVRRWRACCRGLMEEIANPNSREMLLAAVAELALDALIAERWWREQDGERPVPLDMPPY